MSKELLSNLIVIVIFNILLFLSKFRSDGEKEIVDNEEEEELEVEEGKDGEVEEEGVKITPREFISEEAEEEEDEEGEHIDDSSDEDENEVNEYQYDDFMVENAEDEDDGEEETQTPRKKERRKKKRQRKLEKDDYLLMQENLGISVVDDDELVEHGKYKRLKKRKQNDEETFEDDDDDIREKKRPRKALSGSEEEDEEEEERLRRKSRNRGYSQASYIFGDPQEVKDYIDVFETDEYTKRDKYELLREQYEPAVIAENFFTSEDDKIRETDLPERLQARLVGEPPEKSELLNEVDWMLDNLPPKISQKLNVHDQNAFMNLKEQLYTILHFFRVDGYEIPYIDRYQRDLIPDFETEDLWTIFDIDEKWCHFKQRKENLEKMFEKDQYLEDSYMQMLRDSRSLDELNDLLQHFHLHHPEELESLSRHKNPSSNHLYKVCVSSGLKKEVAQITISADQLGDALEMNSVYLQDPPIDFSEFAMEFIHKQPNDAFPTIETVRRGYFSFFFFNLIFRFLFFNYCYFYSLEYSLEYFIFILLLYFMSIIILYLLNFYSLNIFKRYFIFNYFNKRNSHL